MKKFVIAGALLFAMGAQAMVTDTGKQPCAGRTPGSLLTKNNDSKYSNLSPGASVSAQAKAENKTKGTK